MAFFGSRNLFPLRIMQPLGPQIMNTSKKHQYSLGNNSSTAECMTNNTTKNNSTNMCLRKCCYVMAAGIERKFQATEDDSSQVSFGLNC